MNEVLDAQTGANWLSVEGAYTHTLYTQGVYPYPVFLSEYDVGWLADHTMRDNRGFSSSSCFVLSTLLIMTTVCQFENRLSPNDEHGTHSHSHDHAAPGHTHDAAAAEHGHTHEHLEDAGGYPAWRSVSNLQASTHRETCQTTLDVTGKKEPSPLVSGGEYGVGAPAYSSPVGSGKTALLLALCRALRDKYNIGRPISRHPH